MRTQTGFLRQQIDIWGGVLATLVIIALIERGRVTGNAFPLPFLLLYASVVISANRGGLRAGLLSGLFASLFIIYAAQESFGPPTLTGGLLEVMLGILLHMGSATLISLTKSQRDQYLHTLKQQKAMLEAEVVASRDNLSQANLTLAQREARFRALIENSADMTVMMDAAGKAIYVSPTIASMLGYTPQQFIRMQRSELIHPNDVSDSEKRIARVLEKPDEIITGDFRARHKNGEWRVLRSTLRNLLDDPSVGAIVSNTHDITAQAQVEEALLVSEARLNAAQESAKVGSWVLDVGSNAGSWSRQMFRLFDLDPLDGVPGFDEYLEYIHPDDRIIILDALTNMSNGVKPTIQTFRSNPDHGPIRYFWPTWVVEKDQDGKPIRFAGTLQDITQRQLVENALRESEQRFARIFHDSPIATVLTRASDSHFVDVNDKMTTLTGYTREEMIGRSSLELNLFAAPKVRSQLSEESQTRGDYRDIEVQIYTKTGTLRDVLLSTVAIELGGEMHIISMAYDITERKSSQEALAENEAILRSFYDSTDMHMGVIQLVNRVQIYVSTNRAYSTYFGLTPDQVIGKTTKDLGISPAIIELWTDKYLESKTHQRHVEFEFTETHDDKEIYYYGRVNYLGETAGGYSRFSFIAEDITHRKLAEEQYRYHSQLIDNVGDAIISTDPNFVIQSWNQAAETIYGWKAEAAIGKVISSIIGTEYLDEDAESVLQQYQSTGVWIGEVYQYCKDGSKISILSSVSMLRDSTGKTIGSVAVNRDITARKHAESALRQNEAYLRAVVTGTPSILFALDTDGIFTMLEGKSLEAADLEPGSLVGQSAFDPSHHFIPHMKDHFQVALTGQEVASIEQINKIIFDVRYSPLSAEDGEVIGVIGVAADITEHERLRQEQLENEKLQFALKKEQELNEFRMQFMSLVSHDFRTPLTVIQTSASMMQTYRDRLTAAQIDKRVEQISTQILRLTEMLDAVMLVMRGQSGRLEFNPAATNLREFCEDVAATMRTTTGDNQNLTLRAKGDINAVQVDQELLRHILLNLISNAIKYSPDGGTITVTVVREESDIVIRVSDQGIGIPPEDQKRLFQPYQRASNTGSIKGTGLGLSIVKLCAEAHTGNVSVASQPGGGSTFTVVLPDAVVPQKKPG